MLELPVNEFLTLPSLKGARVVAGKGGLDRPVRMIYMLDHPQALEWLHGHELLLTSGAWFSKEPALLTQLVNALMPKGIAGLALGVGSEGYFERAPKALLTAGNKLNIPVIEFEWQTYAVDVIQEGLERIINHQVQHLKWAATVQRKLAAVILQQGGNLREIVDTLAELVGNEVVVEDSTHRVVDSSALQGPRNKRQALDRPSSQDGNVLSLLERQSERRDERTQLARVESGDPLTGDGKRVICPIYSGQRHYGYISIRVLSRPLNEMDLVAAESAAVLIALHFVQEEKVLETERRLQISLFDDLMGFRGGDNISSVTARAGLFGYPILGPQLAIVVDISDYVARVSNRGFDDVDVENQKQVLFGKVARSLEAAELPNVWNSRRDRGLYLVSLGRRVDISEVEKIIDDLLCARLGPTERSSISVGVGPVFTDLVDARRSIDQAEQALVVGRQLKGPGAITLFDRLGYQKVLLARTEGADLDQFVTRQLGALREYDARHGTFLVPTLAAYLEANGQLNVAAASLKVHTNTLYHRLRRIREIGQVDVQNSTDRFNSWLALKILEMKPMNGENPKPSASSGLGLVARNRVVSRRTTA